MRNRALHDALRQFALDVAALLVEDQKGGAELQFDLIDEGRRRGPALYCYRPLTERFIEERWERLRELPSCAAAAEALGAGAAQYLRVNGLRGEQAEPALRAMIERLYEDATDFTFPEERFERVYRDVERTLYRDAVPATVVAPIHGLVLEGARVDLGDGLALVRGDTIDAPAESVWPDGADEPSVLCVLERHVAPDDPAPTEEARERFDWVLFGLRLYKQGGVALAPVGWRRAAGGRWLPIELEPGGAGRGEVMVIADEEEPELREFLHAIGESAAKGSVAWALGRFEMGCARERDFEALSDYLLALRALLDATSDAGQASLGLRIAALCAEEGERKAVQRRVELAVALERFLMRGGQGDLEKLIGAESPAELVAETERNLRALLRDVLCGYLEPDLKGVADDILLEVPDPPRIEARDLRKEKRVAEWRPVQEELPAEEEEEEAEGPEGVTPSADFGWDEDPESYSAPV